MFQGGGGNRNAGRGRGRGRGNSNSNSNSSGGRGNTFVNANPFANNDNHQVKHMCMSRYSISYYLVF